VHESKTGLARRLLRESERAPPSAQTAQVARVSGSLALGHQRRGIAGASSIRLFAGQNGLGDALGTRFSRRAEVGPAPRQSAGSLAKFTVIRRASSRVSRFGRRATRRSNMSGIGGEAEVRAPSTSSPMVRTDSISATREACDAPCTSQTQNFDRAASIGFNDQGSSGI
jgi:hypothetical protein